MAPPFLVGSGETRVKASASTATPRRRRSSLAALAGVPRFTQRVLANYIRHGCSISAAAVSYYTLLTSVPLVLAALAGLGYVLGSNESALHGLLDAVNRAAPGTRNTLETVLTTVIRQKRGVSIIAGISLFTTGTAVFGVLERAMDDMWNVSRRRHFLVSRLIGAVLVILAGMSLLASTLLASMTALGVRNLQSMGLVVLTQFPGLWRLIPLAVQFLLSMLAITLILSVVPNTRVPARAAILGGAATALLWELAKHVFAQYLRHFAPYAGTYGPIGGVIILVVWVYYSAALMLLGAEATALLTCRARRAEGEEPCPTTGEQTRRR